MSFIFSIIAGLVGKLVAPFLAYYKGKSDVLYSLLEKKLDKIKAANDARRNVDPNSVSDDKHNRD